MAGTRKTARKSMFTLGRNRHNQIRKDEKQHAVVVKLNKHMADSGELAPNEGFYRLQALFPTANDAVLHTVR